MVAKEGSVTKAAEKLNLTQPAVSIQLKNLQDQFEIPLTEIIKKRIYITDFGKKVAESAEKIINEVYAINYQGMAHKGYLTGRLKISIVSTAKYVMPYYLTDFLKRHPGIELEMDVTNKEKVLLSLENNEIDFALVSILPENVDVDKLDLISNKLYLVGNKKVRSKGNFPIKEIIQSHQLIYREKGSGTRQTMEKFLNKQNIRLLKNIELTSNEAVKQAVLAGIGISIMPIIGIRNELQNNELHVIPTKGLPIQTKWRLIWLKGKEHSPVANEYLKFLNSKSELIEERSFAWLKDF